MSYSLHFGKGQSNVRSIYVFVCVKVKLSLDSMLETLLALSDTGDGAGRIEQLLKDLRSLQDGAQVRLLSSSHHLHAGQIKNKKKKKTYIR